MQAVLQTPWALEARAQEAPPQETHSVVTTTASLFKGVIGTPSTYSYQCEPHNGCAGLAMRWQLHDQVVRRHTSGSAASAVGACTPHILVLSLQLLCNLDLPCAEGLPAGVWFACCCSASVGCAAGTRAIGTDCTTNDQCCTTNCQNTVASKKSCECDAGRLYALLAVMRVVCSSTSLQWQCGIDSRTHTLPLQYFSIRACTA